LKRKEGIGEEAYYEARRDTRQVLEKTGVDRARIDAKRDQTILLISVCELSSE